MNTAVVVDDLWAGAGDAHECQPEQDFHPGDFRATYGAIHASESRNPLCGPGEGHPAGSWRRQLTIFGSNDINQQSLLTAIDAVDSGIPLWPGQTTC